MMMPRIFLVLGCSVASDAVVSFRRTNSTSKKLDLCGEKCGATICAGSTCFVDYGACTGKGILGSVDLSNEYASVSAPAPGPAPGPAGPAVPPPQVGDVVEITGSFLPSKGLAFEVIQADPAKEKVKLGNGKWYKVEYVKKVDKSTIKPQHGLDFFCRAACTSRYPVIPTYPDGKLDLTIPPTITDPNPKCLHDCQDGADIIQLCKGLCPREGGMCLTECETMMHRCDDMYEDNFPKERMMCVKKACGDMSFKAEPADHGHAKHVDMYKHIEDVSAAPAGAPAPAVAA